MNQQVAELYSLIDDGGLDARIETAVKILLDQLNQQLADAVEVAMEACRLRCENRELVRILECLFESAVLRGAI